LAFCFVRPGVHFYEVHVLLDTLAVWVAKGMLTPPPSPPPGPPRGYLLGGGWYWGERCGCRPAFIWPTPPGSCTGAPRGTPAAVCPAACALGLPLAAGATLSQPSKFVVLSMHRHHNHRGKRWWWWWWWGEGHSIPFPHHISREVDPIASPPHCGGGPLAYGDLVCRLQSHCPAAAPRPPRQPAPPRRPDRPSSRCPRLGPSATPPPRHR